MSLFDATPIPVLQEVIGFTENRHALLAGNVANLDTPGYRTRDLSVETFQERLREAIEAQRAQHRRLSPGQLIRDPDEAMREVRASTRSILYHDQSDVGIEQQVLEISKNQYMHNLAISIMTSQFRLLEAAISERVG